MLLRKHTPVHCFGPWGAILPVSVLILSSYLVLSSNSPHFILIHLHIYVLISHIVCLGKGKICWFQSHANFIYFCKLASMFIHQFYQLGFCESTLRDRCAFHLLIKSVSKPAVSSKPNSGPHIHPSNATSRSLLGSGQQTLQITPLSTDVKSSELLPPLKNFYTQY